MNKHLWNPAVAKLDVPSRMAKLPVDDRGYPVPRFVAWIDGKPDFRVADEKFKMRAFRNKLCWLCGEQLGRFMAFVIGPMCAVNRVSSEPPSHLDCAQFAVRACPFLTHPRRARDVADLPEGRTDAPGIPIERNPGVSLIWITRSYDPLKTKGGTLFRIGDPHGLEWWAHGRQATRKEILDSIESGLPILQKIARLEGPEALKALDAQVVAGLALVPAA